MQTTLNEILKYLESKANQKSQRQMLNKGAVEKVVLGVPQKDLKPLYKKYRDQHALALTLYKEDHLDARSLACMICDLKEMDQAQFDEWIEMTDSAWLIDYQISVTLAGHQDGQKIARYWIDSKVPKKVSAGFYAYCWMLGNRSDDHFTDDEIKSLLEIVKQSQTLTEAMAYFVECVGVSYLPLSSAALALAKQLELEKAVAGIERMQQRGKIGFKRSYLRC